MIISSAFDYRAAAKRKLPRFLFDYIDGGAYAEQTLQANSADLSQVILKQRVLKNVADLSLETELFGQKQAMPIILGPVGITGMYARRGEVQTAKAAANKQIPFTLSTVSVCSLEEVARQSPQPIWFQLYVLKDRGFMKNVLERAQDVGIKNLVFTVDMPMSGARYRDKHSGMSGSFVIPKRLLQAMTKPSWALKVGLAGRPHTLGNISKYFNRTVGLENYVEWLKQNFDPSVSWADLEWIRNFWQGKIIVKGILDPEDAKEAVKFGADGIVVSNHGGRQLDGVLSTVKALPEIVEAVGSKTTVVVDSGIRSGLDVVRMLALGANAVMLGRAWVYALAAAGQAGVENLLTIFAEEMRIALALTGVTSMSQINRSNLVESFIHK
ncbi:FMN-dependent L-lactate dehydrogenase LldD [Legionella hackeliae]|uniref:L-lactate dehydrogenase [cytochrome] n=1 Tax=Legionella hackeliae TaxID=449 RepID=A0A0A8UL03_LEGHA|nr:FMN-dependent L-lactate dehydrogenase LldD [Legionella hackeliae]KTD14839.1 FMN-dependent dehydrogenase [Legionella hackeliae]CEK09535.1 L-lactate dehydrogenase [cytochrome] [Legionella hackeliae]STX49442.1 FMN-dependent dehydrogenase [Legionella hackeliae]